MILIKENEYNQLIPLLNTTFSTTPTNAWAVVEKYIEGNIYSTTTANPKAVLIASGNGTYFICGEPNDAFLESVSSFYKENIDERFIIFSPNQNWDRVIDEIVTDNSNKMMRMILSFDIENYEHQQINYPLNSKFNVYSITRDSISKSEKFDKSYYEQYWGSVDNFLEYGYGFYVSNDNGEIVSECTSIFRSSKQINIDIHTTEEVRGKGLAYTVCKKFINACIRKGLTPIWDCDTDNNSSYKLAQKLGFKKVSNYHLYYK